MPVGTNETCRFELRGDGSEGSVLALNNQFWVQKPGANSKTVWINKTNPPIQGGLIGCNINTGNREAYPKGYAFLENIGTHPDPARSKFGSGPLDDRGGVEDKTILHNLAPLRKARVWILGDKPVPAGLTDIQLYRLMVSGGSETTVEFQANQ